MTRLQFRHHIEVFNSREEAISFLDGLVNNEAGAAPLGESKMGEPILVIYKDENESKHAILAIGKNEGGTGVPYQYIDADFMLSRIDNAEKVIEEVKDSVDEVKEQVTDLTNRVDIVERDMIREIIINNLPAEVQDNVARLIIGAKDIKLTDYVKTEDPKDALHNTDTVNAALGKLEAKSDNNDERLKELEKIQPDEITIIKTPKDKDNIFLSTNLSIKEVVDEKSANFKAVYQLVDGKGNRLGNDIIIYKDSHLKDVVLKTDDKGRASILEFTYVDETGADRVIPINVADFLQEAEFKAGLVVADGEVSVKRDPSSEPFFTITEDGLKVSGINEAINTKVKEEYDRAVAKENELKALIDSEAKKVQDSLASAKNELDNAINAETTRATSKEDELAKKITEESDRAIKAELAISQSLKDAKTALDTSINNEVTRATNAEAALDAKIASEDARILEEAKKDAHTQFDAVNAKINEETNRATAKETEIETLVNSNKTATDQSIRDAVTEAEKYADVQYDDLEGMIEKVTVKPIAPIKANVTETGTELSLAIEPNKILSVLNGELSTTLSIVYDPETWKLQLLGVNDSLITEIDARQFIKTGLIKSITVETRNDVKYLIITYQDIEGKESTVELAVAQLFSPYIASNGIEIKEEDGKANVISVKVNPEGDGKFITLGSAGLGLNGISDAIANVKTNVDSLEKRMSGDATVDGSVAHKVADAKREIMGEFISKTVTDITPEDAAGQTLLRKIGTGDDAEIYASNNTADMLYKGASLETTLDDILEKIDGLTKSMNAIADRLDAVEEKLKNININLNIEGTSNEIKVTKTDNRYIIGFADNAIFGPIE